MSFNGSGVFSPYTPGNPVISGATISSVAFNNTIQDIATGLGNTVTRDGQSPATANIPMGGFKITGLAAGTLPSDAARVDQAAVPTGTLLDFAGSSAPAGFLLCDGSAVSRATYSALFTAISTTWGAGDGSTTFNVPDLRGRTVIGAGTGTSLSARTVGTQNIGEEAHVLSTAELAAHSHTVNDPQHTHTDSGHAHNYDYALIQSGGGVGGVNNIIQAPNTASAVGTRSASAVISSSATGITINNNGSGTAHNNMQPSAVVTKIIKT